jgi:hypothetical protein
MQKWQNMENAHFKEDEIDLMATMTTKKEVTQLIRDHGNDK